MLLSRLVRERMNPLSVDPERFLVAWDEPNGIAAFGQIRPLGSDASELASLVVEPRYRGLGVGTMLAAKLLARHRSGADSSKPLYLVPLQRTQPFYERLGFAPVSSPPTEMRLEVAAGSSRPARWSRGLLQGRTSSACRAASMTVRVIREL